jgi:hypothetical protein
MCFKQADNHRGRSQQGSSFNVRLQSAPRRITTRKGRRQAGDDEVLESSLIKAGRGDVGVCRANRSPRMFDCPNLEMFSDVCYPCH